MRWDGLASSESAWATGQALAVAGLRSGHRSRENRGRGGKREAGAHLMVQTSSLRPAEQRQMVVVQVLMTAGRAFQGVSLVLRAPGLPREAQGPFVGGQGARHVCHGQ